MKGWLHRRSHHRGLHGRNHIASQRRIALLMIGSGMFRVAVWSLVTILYLAHVAFAVKWFASVQFVSLLSILALVLTDWGQVAASLAQWTAGDVHADVEHVRRAQAVDFVALESDIAKLAALQPGPDADALAAEIRARLV